ncbi:MAG: MauE/DoxX family redox-associated membrane protein [Phycisphaerales bacterium]
MSLATRLRVNRRLPEAIVNRLARAPAVVRTVSDGLVHLTRGYLALAAVGKLAEIDRFVDQLSLIGVPSHVAPAAAVAVPFCELALASAWYFSVKRPAAVACAGLLLLLFAGVAAVRVARGDHAPCGCLGAFERTRLGRVAAGHTVLRNTVMLAACLTWTIRSWPCGRRRSEEKA